MSNPIPRQCQPLANTISNLSAQIDTLQEELNRAAPQDKPRILKEIRAKAGALEQAQEDLQTCLIEHPPGPDFHDVPADTVAPVSTDESPVTLTKSIEWSFLQRKLDQFINLRTDAPLFKVRLHNHTIANSSLDEQPDSDVTISMLAAFADNGQVVLGYKPIVSLDMQKLPGGFWFDDINSSSITFTADPGQPVLPFTIKVVFETAGPIELPTHDSLPHPMDIIEFDVTLRLSLTWRDRARDMDFLSWLDPLSKISDDDDLEAAVEQFVRVHLVTKHPSDLGGMSQKGMRMKIYDHLKDWKTRTGINRNISQWLLGGDGSYPVIDFVNDGTSMKFTYQVPKNVLDPFADNAPAGWPFNAHTAPNPALDFSLPPNLAKIDHIVVLTMENRSFDHMLGYLSLPTSAGGMGRTDVDGLKGGESVTFNGDSYPSFALAGGQTVFGPDPGHSFGSVFHQINADAERPGSGRMNGFVRSFADDAAAREEGAIMGYHRGENVPTYDALVRDFSFSHRWFASHPGPTFCNRFYEMTGRLNLASGLNPNLPKNTWELSNSNPLTPVFTKTIFDHLSDSSVSWKYYEYAYCFLRFFAKYTFDDQNIVAVDDPQRGFFADAARGTLPSVCFIDPHFIELPPDANCDGPVADVRQGQALVRRVVEAIVSSPAYASTLLVVTYDEHGGFYDHKAPPPALAFANEVSGATYGVRVPVFFISPRVEAGKVWGHDADADGRTLYFDHTSILKTIARRFLSSSPPYMGARYAAANDLSSVIGTELRTSQFLPFVPYHLFYDATQKRLEVQGAAATPGAGLQQSDPNDLIAQQFSFEDAGGGFFYIRTRNGNLYLTTDDTLAVMQQRKYQTDASAGGANQANLQRWSLTPDPALNSDRTRFTIRNAAFPAKTLQPSGGGAGSGTPVVLGDPVAALGQRIPNPWQVTLSHQSEGATGPAISTALATYTTIDPISVSWAGLPGNQKDWVGIAPSGVPAATVNIWVYVAGVVAGRTAFNAVNLAPGSYVARAFVDDSYTVLAESPVFTVTAAVPAGVSTDRSTYALGQSILVSWTGLKTNGTNWVGYAPAGSPDTTVTRWANAGGRAAGSLLFEGPFAPGMYVARAFANDTYTKAGESAVFVVQ